MRIELSRVGDVLSARYVNDGAAPIALAFWWCRRMRVVDSRGNVVAPGPGPVRPCGAAEDWTVIEPGADVVRDEPMQCTQPAGQSAAIGWSYELAPGSYVVTLLFEAPPAHGFTQSEPDPRAFRTATATAYAPASSAAQARACVMLTMTARPRRTAPRVSVGAAAVSTTRGAPRAKPAPSLRRSMRTTWTNHDSRLPPPPIGSAIESRRSPASRLLVPR